MWFIYAQDDVSYRVFDCLLLPFICIIFEYRDLTTPILVKHFNTLAKVSVRALCIKITGYSMYQFIHTNYLHIQLQYTSAIEKSFHALIVLNIRESPSWTMKCKIKMQ